MIPRAALTAAPAYAIFDRPIRPRSRSTDPARSGQYGFTPISPAIRVARCDDRGGGGALAGWPRRHLTARRLLLLTGFLVLIGAAAAGADARRYEKPPLLKRSSLAPVHIATNVLLRAALLGPVRRDRLRWLAVWAVGPVRPLCDGYQLLPWFGPRNCFDHHLAGVTGGRSLASLALAINALNARPAQVLARPAKKWIDRQKGNDMTPDDPRRLPAPLAAGADGSPAKPM